jgi:hypothetical protein
MDSLKGSCSQSTLKNERLEHWSYRQERNLIDRERLNRDTQHSLETGCPLSAGVGVLYIQGFHPNLNNSFQWNHIGPFLAHVGFHYLLVIWLSSSFSALRSQQLLHS